MKDACLEKGCFVPGNCQGMDEANIRVLSNNFLQHASRCFYVSKPSLPAVVKFGPSDCCLGKGTLCLMCQTANRGLIIGNQKRKRNCIYLVIVVLEKKIFIPVSTGVLLLHTHPIHPCDYFSATSEKTTTTIIHRD